MLQTSFFIPHIQLHQAHQGDIMTRPIEVFSPFALPHQQGCSILPTRDSCLHLISPSASGTTRISGCCGNNVQAQNDSLLPVELTGKPCTLLKYCRSLPTRETMATGTWNILQSCTRNQSFYTSDRCGRLISGGQANAAGEKATAV